MIKSTKIQSPQLDCSLLKRPRMPDKNHLKFVSDLPCIITGKEGVQVCHIRTAFLELGKPHTGRGEKPSDRYVLPMTPEWHEKQHSMNEIEFWEKYGPGFEKAVSVSMALYLNSGDEETCRQIINMARR